MSGDATLWACLCVCVCVFITMLSLFLQLLRIRAHRQTSVHHALKCPAVVIGSMRKWPPHRYPYVSGLKAGEIFVHA